MSAITVPMQVPVTGETYVLPGGTYVPNSSGIINVLQSDMAAAVAAGCVAAHLTQTVATAVAATGTTAGTAAALPVNQSNIYQVTGANGTAGVILQAGDEVIGRVISVENLAAAVLLIYPPTGHTIGGAAANVAYSTASGKGVSLTFLGAGVWTAK